MKKITRNVKLENGKLPKTAKHLLVIIWAVSTFGTAIRQTNNRKNNSTFNNSSNDTELNLIFCHYAKCFPYDISSFLILTYPREMSSPFTYKDAEELNI